MLVTENYHISIMDGITFMKRKVVVKGDRVRGSKEFGIVDYKRCIAPDIMEKRIKNHNAKIERDYQRYVVRGMSK